MILCHRIIIVIELILGFGLMMTMCRTDKSALQAGFAPPINVSPTASMPFGFRQKVLCLVKQLILPVCMCLGLAACSTSREQVDIYDPYEAENRAAYDSNVKMDRALIKPVALAYGTAVPDPVRRGLSNVSSTLSLPGVVVNDILQLKFGDAVHNTARFVLNATLGLGGLFDPATDAGIEERDSDFGETLHVWGFGEGAFVMLPIYGASTTRDSIGIVVDFALDPLGPVLDPAAKHAKIALKVADIVDARYRYSDIYESIIYDSADGYAQLRLSYLDKRRFELGVPVTQDTDTPTTNPSYDIYEDFYE